MKKKKNPMCVLIILLVSTWASVLCAEEAPLPAGLRWGMAMEDVKTVLAASGYLRQEMEIPEDKGDRLKRSVALVNDLRTYAFAKKRRDCTENMEVVLYKDTLFRIAIRFEEFGKGFRDETVARVTDSLGLEARYMKGMNSDVDNYFWRVGDTGVIFTFRELPRIDFYYAALEYCDVPLYLELMRIGLQ